MSFFDKINQCHESPIKRFRNWLKKNSGESLVETLVSTLIIVAVFLMLCTAVVSAAKVNTSIKPGDTVFDSSTSSPVQGVSITVSEDGASGDSVTENITGHVTDNGYVYYEQ